MKIGIFGDSYSDPHSHSITDNPLSWTNILKNKYSLNIANYSRGCTSSFWSLTRLREHIESIDAIVFVLTYSGRIYHPNSYLRLCNLSSVEGQLQSKNTSNSEIYEAAKQYYLYLDNTEFNDFVQSSIINEIKTLSAVHNKKLILIPAFRPIDFQSIFKMSLNDICIQEQKLVAGVDNRRMAETEKPTTANHLLPINNEILAEKVFQLLTDKINTVTLDDFDFSRCEDPNVYWDLSKL